jgi:type IV pilus assembly protein PilA
MAQPYPYTPPPGAGPGMPPLPPTRPSSNAWIIVLAVGGGVGLFFIVLAVMAVSGVRRYVALSKTAEGTSTVGAMARDAVAAYERDEGARGPELCGSAAHPVPRSTSDIAGKKYMSAPTDWTDGPSEAGFPCLRFEMTMPQYYQYNYTSTGPQGRFTAMAKGDLDGDGELSEISLDGEVDRSTKSVRVSPVPKQVRPEE